MTIEQIGALVNSGGVVVLMVAALFGGSKGWWVYGRTYDAKAAESEAWKAIALRSITAAERGASVAEALVNGK